LIRRISGEREEKTNHRSEGKEERRQRWNSNSMKPKRKDTKRKNIIFGYSTESKIA